MRQQKKAIVGLFFPLFLVMVLCYGPNLFSQEMKVDTIGIEKTVLEPGEDIRIDYRCSEDNLPYLWIGIFKAGIDDQMMKDAGLSIKILGELKASVLLNAPDTPGNYQVRLFSMQSGNVSVHHRLNFQVKEKGEYFLIINEILPVPTGDAAPWIELYNPHSKPVIASGLTVIINDRFKYPIPEKLPPVPVKGFVVIQLDGKGEQANRYQFIENSVVLHSPPALTKALNSHPGQVALFKKDAGKEPGKLVRFVAWGASGSETGSPEKWSRVWKYKRFVHIAPSFGVYDPAETLKKGNSVGLYPGGKANSPPDWVIYSEDENTLGRKNPVPSPVEFIPSDGATVRSQDISMGWVGHHYANHYQFRIAKDSEFKSLIQSKTLKSSFCRPEKLPEGTYYYSVQMIDINGDKSRWSKTMKIISKEFTIKSPGVSKDKPKPESPGVSKDKPKPESPGVSKDKSKQKSPGMKILTAMPHIYQRKDTKLLCLDGCASEEDALANEKYWDNEHLDNTFQELPKPGTPGKKDHGNMNCVRASIAMMVAFYGKKLSQDRIAYYTEEEHFNSNKHNQYRIAYIAKNEKRQWFTRLGLGIPEGDLAHSMGVWLPETTAALQWALNESVIFIDTPNPTFAQLKSWLDAGRPIMTRVPRHLRTMNGYGVDDNGFQWVHILDPWTGPRWELYIYWDMIARGTWIGPASAPGAREDEPSISTDSDGDGIMDFDEKFRFKTDPNNNDSDGDGVPDKNDIREYVFLATNKYYPQPTDVDGDGLRKELDPDNDNDSYNDGCEDKNFNGKYEPWKKESNNFEISPPIAAFSVSPLSGDTKTEFIFTANICGEKKDTPSSFQVRWQWKGDNEWTDWSEDKTAKHKYSKEGTFTVTMQIKNKKNITAKVSTPITINKPKYPPPSKNCPKLEYVITPLSEKMREGSINRSLNQTASEGYKLISGLLGSGTFVKEENNNTIYPVEVLKTRRGVDIERMNQYANDHWVVLNGLFLLYMIQDKDAPLFEYTNLGNLDNVSKHDLSQYENYLPGGKNIDLLNEAGSKGWELIILSGNAVCRRIKNDPVKYKYMSFIFNRDNIEEFKKLGEEGWQYCTSPTSLTGQTGIWPVILKQRVGMGDSFHLEVVIKKIANSINYSSFFISAKSFKKIEDGNAERAVILQEQGKKGWLYKGEIEFGKGSSDGRLELFIFQVPKSCR